MDIEPGLSATSARTWAARAKHGDFVNLDYMMDKMDLTNEYDAQAIATFLYTRSYCGTGWREEWRRFNRAEELGFDKLLLGQVVF